MDKQNTTNKQNKTDKQNTGQQRNLIDKFYTHPLIARKCVKAFSERVVVNENSIIIEPSAGNGAFIPAIKSLNIKCAFYDIQPEHKEIIKQDYLTLDFNAIAEDYIHIIGNPPFGRQSSLAIKFIKKSCEYSSSISFILPKSFKKESMQKHFDEHFHLHYQEDLPVNSFLVNNIKYDVPCVFQIWVRKEEKRDVADKLLPIGYSFVTAHFDEEKLLFDDKPDISFRRVGVAAGTIDTNINKSPQSHYFIKFDFLPDELFTKLLDVKFESDNTVGPKSISKQEIIKKYNPIVSNYIV